MLDANFGDEEFQTLLSAVALFILILILIFVVMGVIYVLQKRRRENLIRAESVAVKNHEENQIKKFLANEDGTLDDKDKMEVQSDPPTPYYNYDPNDRKIEGLKYQSTKVRGLAKNSHYKDKLRFRAQLNPVDPDKFFYGMTREQKFKLEKTIAEKETEKYIRAGFFKDPQEEQYNTKKVVEPNQINF